MGISLLSLSPFSLLFIFFSVFSLIRLLVLFSLLCLAFQRISVTLAWSSEAKYEDEWQEDRKVGGREKESGKLRYTVDRKRWDRKRWRTQNRQTAIVLGHCFGCMVFKFHSYQLFLPAPSCCFQQTHCTLQTQLETSWWTLWSIWIFKDFSQELVKTKTERKGKNTGFTFAPWPDIRHQNNVPLNLRCK